MVYIRIISSEVVEYWKAMDGGDVQVCTPLDQYFVSILQHTRRESFHLLFFVSFSLLPLFFLHCYFFFEMDECRGFVNHKPMI